MRGKKQKVVGRGGSYFKCEDWFSEEEFKSGLMLKTHWENVPRRRERLKVCKAEVENIMNAWSQLKSSFRLIPWETGDQQHTHKYGLISLPIREWLVLFDLLS